MCFHQMSLLGEGRRMIKSEQVSSDEHQMSLAGGIPSLMSREGWARARWVPGLMSGEGQSWGGGLYIEVQCIMGNGHVDPSLWTE